MIGGVATAAAVKVLPAIEPLKDVAAPQSESRRYDMRGAVVADDLLRKYDALMKANAAREAS